MENTVTISLKEYRNLIDTNNNYKNLYKNEGYSLLIVKNFYKGFNIETTLLTNEETIKKENERGNEYYMLLKESEKNQSSISIRTERNILNKNIFQLIKWWYNNRKY